MVRRAIATARIGGGDRARARSAAGADDTVPGFDTAVFPLHDRHSVSDALGPAAAFRSRVDSRGAHRRRVHLDRRAVDDRARELPLRDADRRRHLPCEPCDYQFHPIIRVDGQTIPQRSTSAASRAGAARSPRRARISRSRTRAGRCRGRSRSSARQCLRQSSRLRDRGLRWCWSHSACWSSFTRRCSTVSARTASSAAVRAGHGEAGFRSGRVPGRTAPAFSRAISCAGHRPFRSRVALSTARHGADGSRRRDACSMAGERCAPVRSSLAKPRSASCSPGRFSRRFVRAGGRGSRGPDGRARDVGGVDACRTDSRRTRSCSRLSRWSAPSRQVWF